MDEAIINQRLSIDPGEADKIEFRSEEVREIMGTIPHWTIRSGSGYLFVILIMVLTGSWFIRYPDVIKAPVLLTTEIPPANIVAGSPGYLTLWVKDSAIVKEGEYLGYINNNVRDVKSVVAFKDQLEIFREQFYKNPSIISEYRPNKGLSLGELQEYYTVFLRAIEDYQFTVRQKSYQQQIALLQQQASNYRSLGEQAVEQNSILLKDLHLSEEQFSRDSGLYQNKVISTADFEQSKRKLLLDQRNYKGALSAITSNNIQVNELEKRIQDLGLEEQKEHKNLLSAIEAAMNQLGERLKAWDQTYMIRAPFSGQAAFFKYWSDHQYAKAGEEILSVIPGNDQYFARAQVEVAGSGKIKVNQTVHIKLDNFPFQEYGVISGRVKGISLLPKENKYTLIIELPRGLMTNYGRKLAFKQEMSGQAEIITENLRLTERFFYGVRKIFN